MESVHCSMSSSNCCFLTWIQISQEAGQVTWCSHLFQNFPQFVVIHTVKGFSKGSEAEVDGFLKLSWFFYDPEDVDNLISGSSAFCKSSLNIWKFLVHHVFFRNDCWIYWNTFVFLLFFNNAVNNAVVDFTILCHINFMHNFMYINLFIFVFHWSIIDIQCYINFRCTT